MTYQRNTLPPSRGISSKQGLRHETKARVAACAPASLALSMMVALRYLETRTGRKTALRVASIPHSVVS